MTNWWYIQASQKMQVAVQNFHFLLRIVIKGLYCLSWFWILIALVGLAATLGSVSDPSVDNEAAIISGLFNAVMCFAIAAFHRWVLLKWPFPVSLFFRKPKEI